MRAAADRAGIDIREGIEIHNARLSQRNVDYADYLYSRLQRQRLPVPRLPAPRQHRPQRLRRLHGGARRRRRHGHRRHPQLRRPCSTMSARRSTRSRATGSSASRSCIARGRTVLVADTAVHEMPTAEELADIAVETAGGRQAHGLRAARRLPRLFDLRPAGGRAGAEGPRCGGDPRRPPRRLRV